MLLVGIIILFQVPCEKCSFTKSIPQTFIKTAIMKKILLSILVLSAFSCNSGPANDETLNSDSVDIIEPNVINNDIPMRTVDTATNLMMDSMNPRDTMQRPR